MKRFGKGGLFAWVGWLFKGIGWLCLKLIPVALLAVVMVFVGLQIKKILYEDRLLKVQEIRVAPSDALSLQSIRTLEDKLLGKNILLLNLKKISKQIELGPGAQSVRVVREMPNTIRIEIQKRKPIANVKLTENGAYAIVAEDGYIIDVRNEFDPAWILIEDFSEPMKEPRVGMRLQNKGFPEALKFMKIYRRQAMARNENLTRIKLDPYGNVSIRLGEGPDFQMGRKASERIAVLEKALYLFKTEPRENVDYINIQFDRITVKRKQ